MPSHSHARSLGALLLTTFLGGTAVATPVTSHPRLWFTQSDLPRLQSWATPANPLYQNGLLPALNAAIGTYNGRFFPGGQPNPNWTTSVDPGGTTMSGYPAEAYAEFFAFMSQVDNDPNARIAHAQRARNLLMYVINEAAKGHAAGLPYRDPQFASYDRSRWYGEGFGLTVDWIHDAVDLQGSPILTTADKATILQVFTIWCDDNIVGYMAPSPAMPYNNPIQLRGGARNAANNYFSGHMRNMTLMALSLDAADDPNGAMQGYLNNVFGRWLYEQYALYEQPAIVAGVYGLPTTMLPKLGNASGGLPAEGLLYGESLGFVREALLALHTAGYDDPSLAGPQIALISSGYWDRFVTSFLESLPPAAHTFYSWMGPVYQPGGYGDMLRLYVEPSMSEVFAAIGVYDQTIGDAHALQRLQQTRWIVANAIQGGQGALFGRVANPWPNAYASQAILHFMLFDPASAAAVAQIPDPRPALSTEFFDPALGRQLSRTDWTTSATFFGFKCSWISINHQNGDCNQFELFRQGEWLTKEHSNYDNVMRGQTTDFHNTMSILNDKPQDLIPNLEDQIWSRGSQWMEGRASGDPTVIESAGGGYTYAQGDATNLYNHVYPWGTGALDIVAASRSIVWLKPDFIVVYDRATSKTAGRFKRFNLQLVTSPVVNGHTALTTMPSGQQLFFQNLLPMSATLTASLDEVVASIADTEPTQFHLVVEDPSGPSDVRFLNVLQGADANQALQAASRIQSSDGLYDGAVVNGTAVLFPVAMGTTTTSLSYVVPATVGAHLVTGLVPNTLYDANLQPDPNGVVVSIALGAAYASDGAGVLTLNPGNQVSGLTPANATVPASGGSGSVTVSSLDNALWIAVSNAPWITLSGATATSISYAAAANPSTSARSGTVTVGNQTFTLSQAGVVCTPVLSSTLATAVSAAGMGAVNVAVASVCPWTAASQVPWITVTSGAAGTGTGSVSYSVQANSGGARSGALTVAGLAFTVNQSAASSGGGGGGSCSYALSLARKLLIASATGKAVVVTTGNGCAWTASTSASWLSATPASGAGSAAVSFNATANTDVNPRSATLTIGDQTVAVTQAGNLGNGCIYAFGTDAQLGAPSSATVAHGGGAASFAITSPGGCPWTATSNASWITVTSAANGTGNKTVNYSVAANPGTPRTGTLSIGGLIFTVNQS